MAGANGSDRETNMDVGTGSGRGSATGGEVGSATALAAPTPSVEGHGNDGNIDNVWNHATRIGTQGFICRYCSLTKKGGGATRLREHLGGVEGEVRSCEHVPREVQIAMRKSRIFRKQKRRELKESKFRFEDELMHELEENEVIDVPSDEEGRVQLAMSRSLRDVQLRHAVERMGSTFVHGSRSGSGSASGSCVGSGGSETRLVRMLRGAGVGRSSSASHSFDPHLARSKGPIQPRIDTIVKKGSKEKLGQAWAKWFHANDIAGRKANCPYFRAALRVTQEQGIVEHLPKGTKIDGTYLQANYKDLEVYVEKFKKDWDQFGVTVMCDSWTGPTSMSIINFMVYCNENMFFHKSVNASGKIQNADFIYTEIKMVVDEIGHKSVVQIVIDNRSNYKKACAKLICEYPNIFWQPCAAHTINLMLKDIGKFPEVASVVKSVKRICRFFYNHNRLHDEMRKKIGGELIRPNATRFGTVFIFLQSFWDRKDKFRQWMVSEEWRDSDWRSDPDYDYVENCLTRSGWWSELRWVLDTVEPLYVVLRYADQQKICTISGFMAKMMAATHAMEAHLGEGTEELDRYMSKVSHRVSYLYEDTMMVAAAALDPEGHYKYRFSSKADYVEALTDVIGRLADSPHTAVQVLAQFEMFRASKGKFDGVMARLGASVVSPTAWWFQYGGEVKLLQKYALRIVSQCVSSSGCERNWSTFALVHTKVRNRLGYEKLHRLVYVHYNLKLRIQQNEIEQDEKDLDPCAIMMDATLFDQSNSIMDWLNKSQSESCPILDEGGSPSRVILDEICRENSKRKLSRAGRKEKAKKGKMPMVDEEEEFMESDDDDEEDEFEDTSSKDDDDDDGHDDGSGGQEYEDIAEDREAHGHRPQRSKPVKKKDFSSLY